MLTDIKDIFYESYVSSGQARYSGFYDLKSGKAIYFKYLINKWLPSDRSVSIADVACGYGLFLKLLKEKNYTNISGCELSFEQYSIAKKHGVEEIENIGLYEYLDKVSTKDVFVFLDIIEHFDKVAAFSILETAYKKTKTNGYLILHLPNAEGVFGNKIRYADITHEMSYTKESIIQLLNIIGYVNIEVFEDKPIIHNIKSFGRRVLWSLFTLPYRLLLLAEMGSFRSPLSACILVIARKK